MKEGLKNIDWRIIVITVVVALVTAGAIGGGVWYYMDQQNQKLADDNVKQVASLQKQITKLEKTTVATVTPTPTPTTISNDNTSSTILILDKLGIQLTLDKAISDLYYSGTVDSDSLSFSTKSLAQYGSNCSAADSPLGAVSVTNTAPLDVTDPNYSPDRSAAAMVKKLGNKYIYYIHAQSSCSDNSTSNALQTTQSDALKASLSNATVFVGE